MLIDVGAVNQRQINQNGKFIIFPNSFYTDENGVEHISEHLVKIDKKSELVKAIIHIPKESKTKIIEKLKLVGVTKDFLFPDDTSDVCKAIKEK